MVSFINPKHTFTAGENQVKLRGHGNGFCDFENDKKPKEHVTATNHSFFYDQALTHFWDQKCKKASYCINSLENLMVSLV